MFLLESLVIAVGPSGITLSIISGKLKEMQAFRGILPSQWAQQRRSAAQFHHSALTFSSHSLELRRFSKFVRVCICSAAGCTRRFVSRLASALFEGFGCCSASCCSGAPTVFMHAPTNSDITKENSPILA